MKVITHPVELTLPPSPTPRGEGAHASGIIRAIAVHMGVLKPDGVDEPSMADLRVITDPVAIMRICIGLAWEEWYLGVFLKAKGVKKHPGELCVDGIYMNPDGIETRGIVNGKLLRVIHEVKATYKSTNTVGDLSKEWLWLTQIKAYCKGANTRHAQLHGLFLCGDYKFPIRPVIKRWELEFTQLEIDDNWVMLREYRDYEEAR
jgi:hypothetical protein